MSEIDNQIDFQSFSSSTLTTKTLSQSWVAVFPPAHNAVVVTIVCLSWGLWWMMGQLLSRRQKESVYLDAKKPLKLSGLSLFADDLCRVTSQHFSQILSLKSPPVPQILKPRFMDGFIESSSIKVISDEITKDFKINFSFFSFSSGIQISLFRNVPISSLTNSFVKLSRARSHSSISDLSDSYRITRVQKFVNIISSTWHSARSCIMPQTYTQRESDNINLTNNNISNHIDSTGITHPLLSNFNRQSLNQNVPSANRNTSSNSSDSNHTRWQNTMLLNMIISEIDIQPFTVTNLSGLPAASHEINLGTLSLPDDEDEDRVPIMILAEQLSTSSNKKIAQLIFLRIIINNNISPVQILSEIFIEISSTTYSGGMSASLFEPQEMFGLEHLLDAEGIETECSICLTNMRSAVLVPCGHAHFCRDCLVTLTAVGGACPICRKSSVGFILIPFKPKLGRSTPLLRNSS